MTKIVHLSVENSVFLLSLPPAFPSFFTPRQLWFRNICENGHSMCSVVPAVSAAVCCFCRQSRPLTSGPISGSPAWRSSNVTFFYGPSSNKPTNSSWDLVPDFFSLKFSVVLTLVNCRPVTVTLGHPNGLVLQELGAEGDYLSLIPWTHMVESENNFVSCSLKSKHALWPIYS